MYKQLAEAGRSADDIQAANPTPADKLSAFDRGGIDAWAIYGCSGGRIARTRYGARVLELPACPAARPTVRGAASPA